MKIKKEFMLRNVVGENVLIPMGETTNSFNGLISINGIGKFIWENYEKANDEEELLNFILEKYDVQKDVAKKDLDEFLEVLKKLEII